MTVLTGSGEWTVPASLDGATVRAVLIAGGTGGESGQRGTDERRIDGQYQEVSGGGRGAPGSGGKVNLAKLTLRAGETFAYQCGEGGAGGVPSADYDTDEQGRSAYRNNPGETGGATTFGDCSSDGGAASELGYRDIINGAQYAARGPDNGVDGGAASSGREGGNRTNPILVDVEFPTVTAPWDGQAWTAGGYGGGRWHHQNAEPDYQAFDDWAYGGLGGGAAVGSNGGDGADAQNDDWGGYGGHGAPAFALFPADTRAYGAGGSGGHGGGEGGKGGSGNTTQPNANGINGLRGSGGLGSRGQAGKAGCILIYYHS